MCCLMLLATPPPIRSYELGHENWTMLQKQNSALLLPIYLKPNLSGSYWVAQRAVLAHLLFDPHRLNRVLGVSPSMGHLRGATLTLPYLTVPYLA